MNADSSPPNDRWASLVNESYQVMEYRWPTDSDQFNAAMALLHQVRQDFPDDDDGDIPGSAVRCFADALHAAMRLVPPDALSGAVIRPEKSGGLRITVPKDNDR